MDPVAALRALAHAHRLAAFRHLVRAGGEGRSVGELRDELGLPAATLTAHLNVLRAAGLIADEREGRVIRVRADLGRMYELIGFLTEKCCGGVPCAPGTEVAATPRTGVAPRHRLPRSTKASVND